MTDPVGSQQMRALALDAVMAAENADRRTQTGHALRYRKMVAALRAAADQLDAVHQWNWRHEGTFADDELEAILTADTTPQEGRDE